MQCEFVLADEDELFDKLRSFGKFLMLGNIYLDGGFARFGFVLGNVRLCPEFSLLSRFSNSFVLADVLCFFRETLSLLFLRTGGIL